MKVLLVIFSLFVLGLLNLESLADTKYENGTFMVDYWSNEKLAIDYSITSGNTVQSITASPYTRSFLIEISTVSDGVLHIDIPERAGQSGKPLRCHTIETFDVELLVVDGAEVDFTQKRNDYSHILEIPFQNGSTHVEITFTTPPDLWKYKYGCPADNDRYTVIFSPKEQTKNGVEATHILCKNQLVLIHKASTNAPMCVKSETKNELDERGWITCTIIMTDKEKYKIGEKITVTIKNNCAQPLSGSGNIYIAIFDAKGIAQCCSGPEISTRLKPGNIDIEVWNQIGIYNQAEPGMYKIRSDFWLNLEYKETTKWFQIIN